jgi:putative hemolysin
MTTDLLLLLALILLNGVFAMSEIAIVSSKRARLLQMAETSAGARRALALSAEPTRFLSSVQVGITSIGILSGAIGEAAVAQRLRVMFEAWPALAPYADTLSVGIMVVALAYVSLILGELVPKRLALTHPETIAALVSRPMDMLAVAARPLVKLLSVSTDGVLRLFRVRAPKGPGITLEEIRVMLEQGAEEGAVDRSEQEMVSNVLNLDERHVAAILTPRAEIVFLDVRDPLTVTRDRLRNIPHPVLPVCDGGLDGVLGFIRTTRLLEAMLDGRKPDIAALAEPALFVPETMTQMTLLEQFRRTHLPTALVVDEFGEVEGLVSLTDVIAAIVGELPPDPGEEPEIVRRADGSWLMDGGVDLDTLIRVLDSDAVVANADTHVHTLGGLAMLALGRVPSTGDIFERGGFRFEVVDVDGNRVDRVIVKRFDPPSREP